MSTVNPSVTVRTGSANENQLRDDLETLRADIAALKANLGTFAHDAGNAATHGAAEARERLSGAADRLRERSRAALEAAKDKSREAKEAVQGKIEDHPFAAVGIAFGVGVLLGAVISRRN